MAHFARIDSHTIDDVQVWVVGTVIVISNDDCPDPAPDNEAAGQAFIADVLGLPGVWLQTSYHGTFRGTYAGTGYTYDSVADVFVAPPEPELETPVEEQ